MSHDGDVHKVAECHCESRAFQRDVAISLLNNGDCFAKSARNDISLGAFVTA